MKVKTVDIARKLGLSKATVSLALNDKPGVSEATKKMVLECKRRMEEGDPGQRVPSADSANTGGFIKVVIALGKNSIIREDKLNLWEDVNSRFDSIAKNWGLAAEVGYFDTQKDSPESLIAGCNRSAVRGVIVSGTELDPEDAELFRGIRKPLVIFDGDLGNEYSSVVIDNMRGAEQITEYLAARGKKDILYLSSGNQAYNFKQRRKGFANAAFQLGFSPVGRILTVGMRMETVISNLEAYLHEHPLPDAFLAENYLLSIALFRTCKKLGIQIPQDVSIAGIDEVPSFMLDEYELTALRVPHGERAAWTMMALWKEMVFPDRVKANIAVNCEIVEGNTVSAS